MIAAATRTEYRSLEALIDAFASEHDNPKQAERSLLPLVADGSVAPGLLMKYVRFLRLRRRYEVVRGNASLADVGRVLDVDHAKHGPRWG